MPLLVRINHLSNFKKMTAAQSQNAIRFKKAISIRKKTGCSLKDAFAQVYGKAKKSSISGIFKFGGVQFSDSRQFDINGKLSYIVDGDNGKEIFSIDGNPKNIAVAVSKLNKYIKQNANNEIEINEKDIKKFVQQLSKEAAAYNIGKKKTAEPAKAFIPVKLANLPVVKKIAARRSAAPTTEKKQTGRSNLELDRKLQAKPLGKRLSPSGNVYYEYRMNRSDRGKLLGIGDMFDISVISDIDQLKKQYFKLAKKYHPDAGGTTIQFQMLQVEYNKLLNKLLSGSNLNNEQKANEIVIDEAIRSIIDQLINLENINIEVIGKWLWISGNTYPVKDVLKSAGLTFIKKAGVPYWVYKGVESTSRGQTSMEDIKNKYGVTKFDLKPSAKLSGSKKINKTKLKISLLKLKSALNKRPI